MEPANKPQGIPQYIHVNELAFENLKIFKYPIARNAKNTRQIPQHFTK